MFLFVFRLDSLAQQTARRIGVRATSEIESSCIHSCIHCLMFCLSTCADSSEAFQCWCPTIVTEVSLHHTWMAKCRSQSCKAHSRFGKRRGIIIYVIQFILYVLPEAFPSDPFVRRRYLRQVVSLCDLTSSVNRRIR